MGVGTIYFQNIAAAPATPVVLTHIRGNTITVFWECQVSICDWQQARRPLPIELPTAGDLLPTLPRSIPATGARVLDWAVGERETPEGELITEVVYGTRFQIDMPSPESVPTPPNQDLAEALRSLLQTPGGKKT